MSKPSVFFKFVSFQRKDILEKGMIRFTPIGEFNDPFELEPVITPLSRAYIKFCSELSDEEAARVEFTKEDIDFSSQRDFQLYNYKKIYREKINNFGVLSLISNKYINPFLSISMPEKKDPRTNVLMWSHYADSHKGFILEFDSNFIPGVKIEKVEYRNDRAWLTFEDIDDDDFHEVFFNKSEEWSYEHEYRVVLPLSEAAEIKDDKYHLFKFDKKSVRSITFGCAMSEDDKNEIIKLIESDSKFEHVTYNHALLNEDDYCLQFYTTHNGWTNHPKPFGIELVRRSYYQKKLK